MDGNRRFARERGLSTMEGHRLGYEKAKEAADWCREAGIKYLVLYAFSIENWNRAPEEVSYLLDIFRTVLFSKIEELRTKGSAVRFVGDMSRFDQTMTERLREVEAQNPAEPAFTLVVALSYGGRAEILAAVNKLLAEKKAGPVGEEEFAKHLYTEGVPDPDLIIRTSGEQRLSNFLPWQSVYSELYFTPAYWPAFTREEFEKILAWYQTRERRKGR